jgi:hypothetical protein
LIILHDRLLFKCKGRRTHLLKIGFESRVVVFARFAVICGMVLRKYS